jgi:acyl-CoA thioesterase FadM
MTPVPPVTRVFTVRGYEVDDSRTTPLPVVLSFLEQLRWEWIVDPAWGLAEGVHTGHFFVVRRQVLEIVERPRFGDRLTITGQVERIGRSLVVVRHVLTLDDGSGPRRAGTARVTGVWLGPNRRLARLPDAARALGRDQAAALGPLQHQGAERDAVIEGEEALSFMDAPRWVHRSVGLDVTFADDLALSTVQTLTVRPSDCDVFAHVNASQYLRYFDDARIALGHAGVLQRVALDYRAEALAGDTIAVRSAAQGDELVMVLERDGEALCAGVLRVVDPAR